MTAEHDAWETDVAAFWDRFDTLTADDAVRQMTAIAARSPRADGTADFELAGVHDSVGHEHEAAGLYERALERGLDTGRHARRAVQYGSTLRNEGRIDEALAVLQSAPTHEETGVAPRVFLALALHSAGRHDEALRVAIEAVGPTLPRYRRSVRAYARALTER